MKSAFCPAIIGSPICGSTSNSSSTGGLRYAYKADCRGILRTARCLCRTSANVTISLPFQFINCESVTTWNHWTDEGEYLTFPYLRGECYVVNVENDWSGTGIVHKDSDWTSSVSDKQFILNESLDRKSSGNG